MRRALFLVVIILAGVFIACSSTTNIPFIDSLGSSQANPTPTTLLVSPIPTASATPLPTPTPQPAARVESGDRARFEGDWEAALLEYQTALEGSSDLDVQSAALLGIGRTRLAAGDNQGALAALENLFAHFPQSPHTPYAHFAAAQVYTNLGMYSEAAESYAKYLSLRPGVIDGYIQNLRGDALASAGDYPAALIEYRSALESPSTLDRLNLEIKTGQAHAVMGDYETALGIYQNIYNQTTSDYTKAQMDYQMGQTYTALGQSEQAYAAYQDAVNNYPTAYDSYLGLLILVEAGIPVDELNRGIVDYYAGQYGVALAAFDRYFQASPVELATARYYNGLTLRALGGHEDAIAEWDDVIQNYPDDRLWDDAWEQKAYTQYFFLNEVGLGIQTLLQFVDGSPAHPRAGEFLFDAAQVAERDGRLEQAVEYWERVAIEYPGYEEASRALFLAGINRYRLGDYSGAFSIFQNMLANATNLGERAAAYFWQAKSQAALGDQGAAFANWELAANADPTGYYSERARDILRQQEPFTPPQEYDLSMDLAGERDQAEAWLRTTFALAPETDLSTLGPLLSDPRLIRGNELWELGFYEQARAELEDLRQAMNTDPVNSYRLANYFTEIGLYRSAILAAREVLTLANMSDAETMQAPIYFNHIRFGPNFNELIVPSAQNNGFHPLFLFSVVRQESAFEGFVRSSAGARGLMQIIPTTGQEIASELDWPPGYTDEDLYRPLVSVALGSEYLAKWRDHFAGDLYAALAAYNGGPGNAIAWREMAGEDPDLFLEVIRFDETRNYIRSIYEIFNIYRRIYDRTP